MTTDLNEQCAIQCEGYVRAGIAPNGTVWLHPPGERNRSVPVPAYTEDWQACMRLVARYHLTVKAEEDTEGLCWGIGTEDTDGWVTWRKEWVMCSTEAEARRTIVTLAMQHAAAYATTSRP